MKKSNKMRLKYFLITLSLIAALGQVESQSSPYEVQLTPIQVENLGGLQSFSVGIFEGEWLIVGGRLDGLHRRQPFASFSEEGNNQEIIVVNPISKQVWKKSIASLPSDLKEQLSSTNMQFCQVDKSLVLTGGYGYSPSVGDHVTYPFLTVVDIPSVINDVKNGVINSEHFNQITNEMFRVTGGGLDRIDDVYFLVGGHEFMGRYNPMGPDHGPGFIQNYSNEIRKFRLTIGDELQLDILPTIHDEMHLHRRDYNLAPVVADGKIELMAYSGVFQNNVDLPWLYPIQIGADSYKPIESFTQYFNHYHCAQLPIYNEDEEEMNTLFFGGIAQFYMDGDVLVQDNDVPFVNTIADLSMTKDGNLTEIVLDTKMPGYLGAGSEFIFANEDIAYSQGILSSQFIEDEFTVVGYIYGGIRSTLDNIFWINTGAESAASNTIYEVSIKKRQPSTNVQVLTNDQKLFFYPNPAKKFIKMGIELDRPIDIHLEIFNVNGMKIHSQEILQNSLQKGYNQIVLDNVNIGYGAFIYKLAIGKETITRKVVWSE